MVWCTLLKLKKNLELGMTRTVFYQWNYEIALLLQFIIFFLAVELEFVLCPARLHLICVKLKGKAI